MFSLGLIGPWPVQNPPISIPLHWRPTNFAALDPFKSKKYFCSLPSILFTYAIFFVHGKRQGPEGVERGKL